MCQLPVPTPNIPLFAQSPILYVALLLAVLLSLSGWALLLLRRSSFQLAQRQRLVASGAFVLSAVLCGVAYLCWMRLQNGWYSAYHIAFMASHCDPAPVVQVDRIAHVVHGGILVLGLLPSVIGVVVALRGRRGARLDRDGRQLSGYAL